MNIELHGPGIGLRKDHYDEFFAGGYREVGWIEVISENFMSWRNSFSPARSQRALLKARELKPVALHGVTLSVGSPDAVDMTYLKALKRLIEEVDPFIVSDHLCWSSLSGRHYHDLLPIPMTDEAVEHVAGKIRVIQDFLGRRILIENASTYLTFKNSTMTEWEFITRVCEKADCGILLDVNNVYVNSRNHGIDALTFLTSLPKKRVGQIHLAGHTDEGDYVIDTHDEPVCDAVWDLYEKACLLFGEVNSMIEWDEQIPTWDRLLEEVRRMDKIQKSACEETAKKSPPREFRLEGSP